MTVIGMHLVVIQLLDLFWRQECGLPDIDRHGRFSTPSPK